MHKDKECCLPSLPDAGQVAGFRANIHMRYVCVYIYIYIYIYT